ncbi:MAG: hypothetical protein K0Q59_3435 [Paenibacillus sp.]|jgi:hypothetical protein|nr:hypothetical protein [Paenibacillus sp.]
MENSPFNEQLCGRLVGLPVCAVLHEGNRHYGILSKVGGGKIILNDNPRSLSNGAKKSAGSARTSAGAKAASTRRRRNAKTRARLSAFPDETNGSIDERPASPFGGERVALDLANIAVLVPLL